MLTEVVVLEATGNRRAHIIAHALCLGINSAGDKARVVIANQYKKGMAPVIASYGFKPPMPQVMRDQIAAGHIAVHLDLGYWGRHHNGRMSGYHKFGINDRHPTNYFQKVKHDGKRAKELNIKVRPWLKGGHKIIVAGQSAKAANTYGFKAEEWERWAIGELRKHTNLVVWYRPKPSWVDAAPIEGAGFANGPVDIEIALIGCHALVTHHSNAAVDALVYGVPAFCVSGVTTPMALSDLSQINTPAYPDGREQWVNDVAYTQWSVPEIVSGAAWKHYKDEGLVP